MVNRILLVLLSLIVAGCSTTQVQPGTEQPIPPEHIYNADYLIHKPGNEIVNFTRDQGMLGSACSHMVFIDNDKAFEIFPGQAVAISLKPGNHLFRLDTGRGSCPNETHSQETFLVLGEPQTYRISISSNFNLMLTRIK